MPAAITNERHIVPAIHDGDAWTTEIVRQCTYPLAHMIRVIAVTNAVQRVAVIGGFAAGLGSRYLDLLQEGLDENRDFHILAPHLDELLWREPDIPEECLLGAATYGRVRAGLNIEAAVAGSYSTVDYPAVIGHLL